MNLYRLSRKPGYLEYDDFVSMVVWAESETAARTVACAHAEWHDVSSVIWLDPERTDVRIVELDEPKVVEACFRHG